MERVDLLVLDDEASVRRALERLFASTLGLAVATVGDPREAIALLEAAPPKVLLTDYRMPGMDGVQVLREARRLAPETVRILMTGMAERGEVIDAINGGKIFRFVEKPWDEESLLAIAAEAIESHDHARSGRLAQQEREALRRAVDMAGSIQRSMLPDLSPRLRAAEAACHFAPCEYASGDYVDIFDAGPGRTALVLGDVSGHGIGAALFVSSARALLRSGLSEGEPLARVVARTNRFLCRDMQNGRFLTLFAGLHDAARGTLEFVNAGQTPPLLLQHGTVSMLPRTGLPLGVLEEADYARSGEIPLEPGATLLACTDGVTEARDATQELFGLDRLSALLAQHGSLPPAQLVERVRAATLAYSAGAADDDLTILAYRPTGAFAPVGR